MKKGYAYFLIDLKVPVAKNQQIQNFDCFKYVRICAENVLHKNEVF